MMPALVSTRIALLKPWTPKKTRPLTGVIGPPIFLGPDTVVVVARIRIARSHEQLAAVSQR
jgi:hypothetical protein